MEPASSSLDDLSMEMYNAIATTDDIPYIFKLLVQGADIKWQNPDDEMKTAMHCAVIFDKVCSLELLIQNGGDIFCRETRDWSPMVMFKLYLFVT